jgi:membrane-associated phospholipid phosphatase
VWYAADYVAVLLAGGLVASGVLKDVAPAPASIGPRFALDKPDLAVLFDPRLDDVIGRPMVREKVPTAAVAAAAAVAALGTAAVDLAGGGNLPRTHALLLGSTEALLGTVADNVPSPAALDCTSVADGFVVSRADVLDGMKSFPSGHTSSSFALLSFSTLAIGSRWIWGDDAPAWAQPVAGLVIGALAAGAGFTAASRQSDGRHHAEDVAVGAAVGTAIGASTWLVHFDTRGRARTRWPVRLAPTTMTSAAGPAPGLALTGSFG